MINLSKSKIKIQSDGQSEFFNDLKIKLKFYSSNDNFQTVEFMKETGGLMDFLEFITEFKTLFSILMDKLN